MGSCVTLVTGIPRSGTSLMMQMLRAGGMPVLCDASRPPDPDNPRGYLELEAVRSTRRDASWLHAAAGQSVASHLVKLEREGRVERDGAAPQRARWKLA